MIDTTNPHVALSDNAAKLIEHAASSVVSVHGGSRRSSSGIHWRSGIIVTAEEVLERDEDIKLTLPGGRTVDASLVGRDPTTDVAVLRLQPDGLPTAATATASLRAGEIIFGVGSHEGTPLAAFGIVALASGAWRSSRGGTIDHFIRLDLALNPVAEGGRAGARPWNDRPWSTSASPRHSYFNHRARGRSAFGQGPCVSCLPWRWSTSA